MCVISIKTFLIVSGAVILFCMIGYTFWPLDIHERFRDFQESLPKPHLTLQFSAVGLEYMPRNFSEPFINAGYVVENGHLVRLSNGTCTQCFGSPIDNDSYFAVSFKENQVYPLCSYNNSDSGTCFRMRKSDAIVIITEGLSGG